jgi:hypothetical protein
VDARFARLEHLSAQLSARADVALATIQETTDELRRIGAPFMQPTDEDQLHGHCLGYEKVNGERHLTWEGVPVASVRRELRIEAVRRIPALLDAMIAWLEEVLSRPDASKEETTR